MVMSTRRLASSATTLTPLPVSLAKALPTRIISPTRAPSRSSLRIDFAPYHDLLRLVVEGDFLAGLDGGDVHAERDGVAVAGFNAGVGRFAGADALHPVAHVGGGLRIAVGDGARGDGSVAAQREARQQVGLHLHFGGGPCGQATFGRDFLLVHVDHAAVGVVELLDAAGGVGEARRILHLEALGKVVERAVVEDGGHGVPVLTTVFPEINSAVGDDAARMREAAEPMDSVDLMHEPLVGNARGIGPEQAELEVLASVEWDLGTVHQVPLPVGVFFLQQWDDVGAAPASGLVDVPCHFHHDDVAELAGLDVLRRALIAGRAAALRSYLDDLAGLVNSRAEEAGVVHGVGRGLFDVGVAAGVDGFCAVARVLEVGGGDEDGVDVLAGVELVVVAHGGDGVATDFLDVGCAFFAAAVPDVGDSDELEVHVFGVLRKCRDEGLLHAVSAADDADLHAIVGADDGRVAGGAPGDGCCRCGGAAGFEKLPAIMVRQRHRLNPPSGLHVRSAKLYRTICLTARGNRRTSLTDCERLSRRLWRERRLAIT